MFNKIMRFVKATMDIYILRHGKAEERMQNITSDSKRQLTALGKKELDCIAKAINGLEIKFNYVISSPLVRAKQTAEIILKHVKCKTKSIIIWNELKPESHVIQTINKLTTLKPTDTILLVGHEPHLTSLISKIISDSETVDITLKKGGFAHIRGYHQKSEIRGSLRSILTTKQLKKLCK